MTEILTTQEVCEYLRISKPTLYRYVRTGELPGFKTGKIWKFHRHAIDKWVRDKVDKNTEARGKPVIQKPNGATR